MVDVPIQPKYVVLGGLLVLLALAAVLFIPYHRLATPRPVHDQQGSVTEEQAAPVLSVVTDGPLTSGNLTVDGVSVPVKEGSQQISTPHGTATVTVNGDESGKSTQSTENSGSTNINITTQNSNSSPSSSISTSFSSSTSSSHVLSSTNVSAFSTNNGNVHVQISK